MASAEQQNQEAVEVDGHASQGDGGASEAMTEPTGSVAGVDLSDVDLSLDDVPSQPPDAVPPDAPPPDALVRDPVPDDQRGAIAAATLLAATTVPALGAPLAVGSTEALQAEPLLSDGDDEPPRKTRKRPRPGERRMQILQMLAEMLESPQADRVTTAALAARLDVSEAALYRHFASKAQMFEGLIGFIEQTLFGLINQITAEEEDGFVQLRAVYSLLLTFAERNPGMTRVLIGDALVTEADRLQDRINQLTDRLELSIKQCYRTLLAEGRLPPDTDPAARANLMMSCVQGHWLRFAKGGFQRRPTEWLDKQMALLIRD